MCFKGFSFLKFDYKKLNVFYSINKIKGAGLRSIYRVCKLSGVSLFSFLQFRLLPKTCIRCINFSLGCINLVPFKRRFALKTLRELLFNSGLPCNGQRSKTNAKTAKSRFSRRHK